MNGGREENGSKFEVLMQLFSPRTFQKQNATLLWGARFPRILIKTQGTCRWLNSFRSTSNAFLQGSLCFTM